MLAGFLTVLKIIGIVLLVVLALILFILLLVLFVPVRYKLDGNIPRTNLDEGFDINKIYVKASFSWLLHFISGGIEYPEKKQFEIKVLGIKVFPFKKKEKSTDKENKEKVSSSGVIEMSDMKQPEGKKEAADDEKEIKEEVVEVSASSESTDENIKHDEDENKESEEEDEKSFLDVLWNIIDKLSEILEKPQNVFAKIKYTISRVYGKISMVKSTIENDIFKRAFDLVKRKLIKIIKMILPDKCDIILNLGTGDPAQTAEFVGVYSALYPIVYNKIKYEPDFDEKVLEVDAHIKGHITASTIVYSAAVCFFNKDVKKVIRRFKKILNS